MKKKTKEQLRKRRQARVRAKISGTLERPRLNVSKSLTNVFVQLIDDVDGKTIASVHSKSITVSDAGERKGKVAAAYTAGKIIAEKAKEAGITTVVFDRGGNLYHGRVQAVADGARDGGLTF